MEEIPLVVEQAEVRLSPPLITEVSFASLGYRVAQSAKEQGITVGAVKNRRKLINKALRARTIRQSVVEAIHLGYLPVDIEQKPEYEELSLTQTMILHLVARGWIVDDIAKRLEISRHTVNSHYEEIRRRLGARNINHAMCRAFELGIFKIGEEVVDPDELIETRTRGLQVSMGGHALSLTQIGILHPHQVEVLELLPKLELKDGIFTSKDISALGFYEDAPSDNAKAHALGRAVVSIAGKLERAFGEPLLGKFGPNRQRGHGFRKPVEIGRPDAMHALLAFDESLVQPKPPRKRRTKRPARPPIIKNLPVKSAAEKRATIPAAPVGAIAYGNLRRLGQSTEYNLEPSSMPELNEDFLLSLEVRDPQEVLENMDLKIVVAFILRQNLMDLNRVRVSLALRYGINPELRGAPLSIRRNGDYIKLGEIMEYVPAYQGLSVKSTSEIVGLKPIAITLIEKAFIEAYKEEHPVLNNLKPFVEREEKELNESLR